jgi:O-antigen/teichoic acid export membrane protein
LSYISKKREKITLKLFWWINFLIIIFSIIASFLSLAVSKYILILLYPDLFLEASKILLIANFAVILLSSTALTQTILLRYSNLNSQIIIQIIYGVIYIVGGIVMINNYDLIGFCIAALLAALIRFFLIFILGTFSLKGSVLAQRSI